MGHHVIGAKKSGAVPGKKSSSECTGEPPSFETRRMNVSGQPTPDSDTILLQAGCGRFTALNPSFGFPLPIPWATRRIALQLDVFVVS
jgi:hypothetical protein